MFATASPPHAKISILFQRQKSLAQHFRRIVENRCAEEKEDLLFAKRALMTFQIHFVDVIILFSFAYKTIILHAQF